MIALLGASGDNIVPLAALLDGSGQVNEAPLKPTARAIPWRCQKFAAQHAAMSVRDVVRGLGGAE